METSEEVTDAPEEESEDQTWVLDSLVGFLKSPLWSSSINNFADQMSVVFEPDDIEDSEGQVERRPEYESIFKQYRGLVDQLICSHMSELGISEEQFALACELAEGQLAGKLKSVLFEELWAAENFEVFIRLMARRNVELQLEALDTLAQKYGLVYDVFVPIGTSPKAFLSEEHVMREAILRSLDDLELEQGEDSVAELDAEALTARRFTKVNQGQTTGEKGETGASEAPSDGETAEFQRDKARLEEVRQRVDEKMAQALQSALTKEVFEVTEEDDANDTTAEAETTPTPEPIVEEPKEEAPPIEEAKEATEEDDGISEIESASLVSVSREEEIKKRAEHLRAQRDRIIQMKQKERTEKISKYLTKEKESGKELVRPKTARRPESATSKTGGEESKELAYRKTLAARLKAEVIFGK